MAEDEHGPLNHHPAREQLEAAIRGEVPLDQKLAHTSEPPIAVLPQGFLGNDSVYVSARICRVGSSNRWVGVGDLLTEEEAGDGVSHGSAYRLPAKRGVIGLLRAYLARVKALEELIASGDAELLDAERASLKAGRLPAVSDSDLLAEAESRGLTVEESS